MAIVKKYAFVYIMTNKNNTVLYTGVTSGLRNRVWQHKTHYYTTAFTHLYNCEKLIWFEMLDNISLAIMREKQIKAGSRKKKIALIEKLNPEWNDLWDQVQNY